MYSGIPWAYTHVSVAFPLWGRGWGGWGGGEPRVSDIWKHRKRLETKRALSGSPLVCACVRGSEKRKGEISLPRDFEKGEDLKPAESQYPCKESTRPNTLRHIYKHTLLQFIYSVCSLTESEQGIKGRRTIRTYYLLLSAFWGDRTEHDFPSCLRWALHAALFFYVFPRPLFGCPMIRKG